MLSIYKKIMDFQMNVCNLNKIKVIWETTDDWGSMLFIGN